MLEEYKAKLVEKKELTPSVTNFIFELDKDFSFKAGQFINLSCIKNEKKLMKPYSIASSSTQKNIELCVKRIDGGEFTENLFEIPIGFEFDLKGPFGMFTLNNIDKEKLVFVGTGTGISPLRSMIKELIEQNSEKEITLLFGVRYENEVLFEDEFIQLENENPNFKLIKVISKPTDTYSGRVGHVQDNLDSIDPLNSQFFICGLVPMVEGVQKKLEEMGVQKENIHFERYV